MGSKISMATSGAKRDYYEVLGVSEQSTPDDIRRAYRQLARKYHPDVNPGNAEAEANFKEINEAQEILLNPEARARYDQYGHSGGPSMSGGGGGAGFGDIFDMFFGAGAAQQQRAQQGGVRDGADLRYELSLTLEEAALGADKVLKITRLQTCSVCTGSGAKPGTQPQKCVQCAGTGQVRHVQNTILGSFATVVACPRCRGEGIIIPTPCTNCQGSGRVRETVERPVKIPAGVDSGTRVQLRGEGDAGVRGGDAGDLYIMITVQDHSKFQRKGSNLFTPLDLSYSQLALGTTVEAQTLFGNEPLNIPPGTQPGASFRLRGKGMPDVTGQRPQGDLHVVVNVKIPTHLNDEQRRLLRELAAAGGEDVSLLHEDKGLLSKVKGAFGAK